MSSLHISAAATKSQTYRPMHNIDAEKVEERGLRAPEGAGSCQGIARDFLHGKSDPLVDNHEHDRSSVEESWLQRAASDGRSHVVQVRTAVQGSSYLQRQHSISPPAFCADHFHPGCLADDRLRNTTAQ